MFADTSTDYGSEPVLPTPPDTDNRDYLDPASDPSVLARTMGDTAAHTVVLLGETGMPSPETIPKDQMGEDSPAPVNQVYVPAGSRGSYGSSRRDFRDIVPFGRSGNDSPETLAEQRTTIGQASGMLVVQNAQAEVEATADSGNALPPPPNDLPPTGGGGNDNGEDTYDDAGEGEGDDSNISPAESAAEAADASSEPRAEHSPHPLRSSRLSVTELAQQIHWAEVGDLPMEKPATNVDHRALLKLAGDIVRQFQETTGSDATVELSPGARAELWKIQNHGGLRALKELGERGGEALSPEERRRAYEALSYQPVVRARMLREDYGIANGPLDQLQALGAYDGSSRDRSIFSRALNDYQDVVSRLAVDVFVPEDWQRDHKDVRSPYGLARSLEVPLPANCLPTEANRLLAEYLDHLSDDPYEQLLSQITPVVRELYGLPGAQVAVPKTNSEAVRLLVRRYEGVNPQMIYTLGRLLNGGPNNLRNNLLVRPDRFQL